MEELLTVSEIARACRVHEMTIRRHINAGELKALRVGRTIRVRREDLDDFLAGTASPLRTRARRRRQDVLRPLTETDAIFRLAGIVSVPP